MAKWRPCLPLSFPFSLRYLVSPVRSCHFVSNKPCFQGSTTCNFEIIFEKGRGKNQPKKGNPVNGEHSQRWLNLGPDAPNLFFFFSYRSDLVWSFCQPVGNWVGSITRWGHQSLNWLKTEVLWYQTYLSQFLQKDTVSAQPLWWAGEWTLPVEFISV